MKQETKNIILIISISFNIAFIGMFLYHLIFMPKLPEPPERDVRRMRHFARILPKDKEFHNEMKNLLRQRRNAREEFMKMLTDKDIDDRALDEKLKEVIRLENKISKFTGKYMIKCRNEMDSKKFRDQRNHKQRRRNEKD